MVSISGEEVHRYLTSLVDKFKSNPFLNSYVLHDFGLALCVLGSIKNLPLLKVIGDLLSEAPEKLRNIISLRYSLIGTFSELQEAIMKLSNHKIVVLLNVMNDLVEELSKENIDTVKLEKLLDILYKEVVETPLLPIAGGPHEE